MTADNILGSINLANGRVTTRGGGTVNDSGENRLDPEDAALAEALAIAGAALADVATARAIAMLIPDPDRPDISPTAVITVTPIAATYTYGRYPGADVVDTTLTRMLDKGFVRVTAFDGASLDTVPLADGWSLVC